jgi:hypothetical protein
MQLSATGESRVRGYLFILERSLRTFLPAAVALDASREVESHIMDRVAETEAVPDERTAIERVLAELGAPLEVARAYSLEMAAEEAVTTGRIVAIARSLLQMAALGIGGFFAAIAVFVGYVTGLAFLAIAALKPIFPDNVGLFLVDGVPLNFGAQFPRPDGAVLVGGYWVIVVSATIGVAMLVLTHRLARRLIERWLRRRRNRILDTKHRSDRS